MPRLHKSAGIVEIESWTGGWPRWISITVDGVKLDNIKPEDLRDLHYCAERMLAMIAETGGDA